MLKELIIQLAQSPHGVGKGPGLMGRDDVASVVIFVSVGVAGRIFCVAARERDQSRRGEGRTADSTVKAES